MLDILFSPDQFFRERAGNPGLRGPLLVVTVVAVLGVVAAYPAAQAVRSALPPEAQGFGGITVVTTMVGALIGPFAGWVLYTGVFHGISAVVYDGEGSFGDTLKLVGWGFVPALLTGVVGCVVAFLVWPSVTFPEFSDPARVQQFTQEIRNRPAFLVQSVLGLAVLVWQGLLWTFAVQYAREIEFRKAAVSVVVPVLLVFLWKLNGIVGVV